VARTGGGGQLKRLHLPGPKGRRKVRGILLFRARREGLGKESGRSSECNAWEVLKNGEGGDEKTRTLHWRVILRGLDGASRKLRHWAGGRGRVGLDCFWRHWLKRGGGGTCGFEMRNRRSASFWVAIRGKIGKTE